LLKAAVEPAGQTMRPCQRGSARERDSGRPELMPWHSTPSGRSNPPPPRGGDEPG
jgi:hypothetical protein